MIVLKLNGYWLIGARWFLGEVDYIEIPVKFEKIAAKSNIEIRRYRAIF